MLANGGKEATYGPAYPARSGEFLDLLVKVTSFMGRYQKSLTRGGAHQTPEVLEHLLIDGYRWNNGAVGISF